VYAAQAAVALVQKGLQNGGHDCNIAVVDVGTAMMNVNILRNNESIYTREQSFGGHQLTQEIQNRYGLSLEEAESAKRLGGLPDTYRTEVLAPFMDTLGLEVARALQHFYASTQHTKVDHILLAGGCSAIPGIDEVVTRRTQINTVIANPFSNMALGPRVKPRNLSSDAPALMIACGLALRRFTA
ncbi:MAG: type IV pilus assembly protein PilM, partial [Burkholderiales bacterium]